MRCPSVVHIWAQMPMQPEIRFLNACTISKHTPSNMHVSSMPAGVYV